MKCAAIRCLWGVWLNVVGIASGIVRAAAVFSLIGFATAMAQAAPTVDDRGELTGPQYAIAMHGAPALQPDLTHFSYANPAAPKGGRLVIGFQGTFDSLNPFNIKSGSTAQGLNTNIFQTLMARSADEPFAMYGLIAKSIETDADRTYAIFRLDPRARFSDGTPITSADVLFTFELLKEKGRPQQRAAYTLVKHVETPDAETIRFDFPGVGDRETATDPRAYAGPFTPHDRSRDLRIGEPGNTDRLRTLSHH